MGLAEGKIEFNLSIFWLLIFYCMTLDSWNLLLQNQLDFIAPTAMLLILCRRVEVSNYSTNWNVHLTNSNYFYGLEGQTVKDIRFVLIATSIRHSGTVEFVIVHFTDLRAIPINNQHFSIEKWRKPVGVISAHIHRVLMVWMQPELPPAANVQMAFWFLILPQDPNGNWLVISKKMFSKYFLKEMIN